jgi:hypothetical protein
MPAVKIPRDVLSLYTVEHLFDLWHGVVLEALEDGQEHFGWDVFMDPAKLETPLYQGKREQQERLSHWLKNRASDLSAQEVAGSLLHRVVTTKPYWDCNHRTGWSLCSRLMREVGFEPSADLDEAKTFVLSIDKGVRTKDDVVAWVRKNFQLRG